MIEQTSVAETVSAHMTTAGAQVGRTLAELGVRTVFGVVGSGNFVATDALVEGGARFVAARHEAGATGMVDGYWRSTGQVAACSVHQGPGFTNTLTALTEAAKSRVPLVLIAGTTSAGMTRSNFFIDQAEIARLAGAIAETVHHSETAVEDTARAFHRAVNEQRPVVLNLPLDVQAGAVGVRSTPRRAALRDASIPAPEVLMELAEHLLEARRPLIIAGRGAWRAGAREVLQNLAEETGALLATTAVAKGLFAGHPRDLGVAGGFSSDAVARVLSSADVVVGFGASYTHWTTRANTIFSPEMRVVQVDSDPNQIALNPRVDMGVVGDVAGTAEALLGLLSSGQTAPQSEWTQDPPVVPELQQYADSLEDPADGVIHPARLTSALDAMVPAQRTLVIDGGHFIGWPATGMSVPDPSGFLFSSAGFQSIGLGLGIAAGAAVGRPDRTAVLAVGDGGFLMSVADLETLVRERLPVLVVVYNDAAYGAEVHHFANHESGLHLVQFPQTDIASIARGYGAEAVTVRDLADLQVVEAWLATRHGPLVVDARIMPDVVGYWAAQDFIGH
jgi:thiamine pyrophosphate-dependent acetolactate synthase large subunit-like protein